MYESEKKDNTTDGFGACVTVLMRIPIYIQIEYEDILCGHLNVDT